MQINNTFVIENKQKYLDELISFLKIKSVSADSAYQDEVLKAADFLKEKLEVLGLKNVEVCPTAGNPIVYAETEMDAAKPTVLVYGHYDVQPVDPIDLWDSPPFEPVIKDEKIYARGACDDKGQLYMHVKALEVLQHEGELPCNVKFALEGEEEVGSVNLEQFIQNNRKKLACDVVLISDTSMIANDVPSITTGLRGLAYLEVEITGPNRDLHSGTYGGAVTNPINALAEMITKLRDENYHITIPGFYDNVVEYTDDERKLMAERPHSEEEYKKALDVEGLTGEAGYSTIERASIRPTLDVNGIWGGYIGEGAKTVLPSKAFAKISMRLVPNQTDEEITKKFTEYFKSLAPAGIRVEVRPHHGGLPAVTPINSLGYQAASIAMQKTFGKDPIPTKEGGSIPIVSLFETILNSSVVLMGFGLDSDAIHSPNEHYGIFNFLKGIETIPEFHKAFASLYAEKKA